MISQRTKVLLEKGYGERVGEIFGMLESLGSLKSADLAAWYAEKAEWEHHQGKNKEAMDFLRRGLGIRQRMGDEAGAGRIYSRLGQIFAVQGKQQRALNYYEAGLESFQKVEDWGGAAQIHAGIGRIYRDMGQMSRASLANLRALAMLKTTGKLSHAAIYLALAPKDNSSYRAYQNAKAEIEHSVPLPAPLHLRNAPTKLMKALD